MALGAGTLFAINGTVSKVILESGMSSLRLTEVRCIGGLIGLALILLLTRPQSLRTSRRESSSWPAFGVFGVALVQVLYFLAIHRLADRRLAPDPVPRAVDRRALRALRDEGARAPAPVGRARAGVGRAHPRRRSPARRVARRPRRALLPLLGVHVCGLPAARRAGRRAPRPDLAPLLGLPVRERLLGDRPAVVELPVRRPRHDRLPARQPLATCTCRSGS